MMAASCSAASTGEKQVAQSFDPNPFQIEEMGQFEKPWSITFDEGTGAIFVTEKKGHIKFIQPNGKLGTVTGIPTVDYGGQAGLGDFVFAPGQTQSAPDDRIIYLSWAEAGVNDTRGAAVGRANMVCVEHSSCELRDLEVVWRQQPKVSGRGHFSHRLAFSPNGEHLFVASGDRQKRDPAQDNSNNLGTIVRLLPDGHAAPGNPLKSKTAPSNQIWSWGHRNILGLAFDSSGRLWDLEHGPAGGDELNLVSKGKNYGWPVVSNGRHYSGKAIPDHSTRPDLNGPAVSWNPVIAPGDMIFYSGTLFADWQGDALIAAMKPAALVRVRIAEDNSAREVARYRMDHRIRAIAQAADGAVWVVEDGKNLDRSRLLRLTPRAD